jgi:hypothetical protein
MKANRNSPASVIALTLWGEARGEGDIGLRAVASVIHYGSKQKDRGLVEECLRPWRYSCWQKEVFTQTEPKSGDIIWGKCLVIAGELLIGKFEPMFEASHYFNPDVVPGRWPKSWNLGRMQYVTRVKHHEFWLEI